jgi:hypothetical protein
MLEFLIDSIFVSFGGALFQQVVGISMGTNCAPLLAELNYRSKAINATHIYVQPITEIRYTIYTVKQLKYRN